MSRLIPGTPVIWGDKKWILLDIPDLDRVLVRNPETGQTELVSSTEIQLDKPKGSSVNGLMQINDEEWGDAWRRFQVIRPLLGRSPRQRTKQEVLEVASALGKDATTIYRWITKWEKSKTVSALLRSQRSDNGKSRLPETVEAIVQSAIESSFLVRERPTHVELWERVAIECRKQGLTPPNLSTLRRRINQLQDRLVMTKRHGSKMARESKSFFQRCKHINVSEKKYREWIDKSIEFCKNLKSRKNIPVEVRLYDDYPIWKMIFTSEYMWLQWYQNVNVDQTPVYNLQTTAGKDKTSLYYPMHAVFRRRWDAGKVIDLEGWVKTPIVNSKVSRRARK